jgi:hypothetical protein
VPKDHLIPPLLPGKVLFQACAGLLSLSCSLGERRPALNSQAKEGYNGEEVAFRLSFWQAGPHPICGGYPTARNQAKELMDLFFEDPSEIPLPPGEVRIRELSADPWPDGQRIRVYLEVDPFQQRPNADVFIYDKENQEISQTSIIGSMSRRMEFTMHIRRQNPAGEYRLLAILFYTSPLPETRPGEQVMMEMPDITEVDRREISFSVSGPPAESD